MEIIGNYKQESGANEGLHEAVLKSGRDFFNYDPVGLPDDEDERNVRAIVSNFHNAHPGVISFITAKARDEKEAHEATTLFQKKEDKPRRRTLSMPTPLLREIEEAYPLMFLNRKHLAWFKKHFPIFVVG
jgi:hypothetical protein